MLVFGKCPQCGVASQSSSFVLHRAINKPSDDSLSEISYVAVKDERRVGPADGHMHLQNKIWSKLKYHFNISFAVG